MCHIPGYYTPVYDTCRQYTIYDLCKYWIGPYWIPYSGLFLWGANFRYFRCHEFFHPQNFLPTLQLVLTFGPSDVFYSSFSLLVPCWQCPWSVGSPFSRRVLMEEVNREVNKAEARRKNGASTSRSGMRAPTEFVLCRRGSLPRKTRHWSAPSFL